MKVALLLSGRFFGTDNHNRTVITDIYKCNTNIPHQSDIHIDTYMHMWEVEYKRNISKTNDISSLLAFYNPTKYVVENYNEHFSNTLVNSLLIMSYHRKQTFKLVDSSYDVYIITRPDIIIKSLSLYNYEYIDNTVYAYRCPQHAYHACFDFCDWFYMCNYNTLTKIMNINYDINHYLSNETNMKKNLIDNGINIIIIGTVGNEIEYIPNY